MDRQFTSFGRCTSPAGRGRYGLARSIQRKFREQKFRIETVPSPGAAQEVLNALGPDLVLFDLDTADPGGCELISEIRSQTAVAIVAISSRATEQDVVGVLECGAVDFLAKPFGLDELLARVRVALRHVAKADHGADALVHLGELQLDIRGARRAVMGMACTSLRPSTDF